MTTFTESQIRQRAQRKTGGYRQATTVLKEEVASAKTSQALIFFLAIQLPTQR